MSYEETGRIYQPGRGQHLRHMVQIFDSYWRDIINSEIADRDAKEAPKSIGGKSWRSGGGHG